MKTRSLPALAFRAALCLLPLQLVPLQLGAAELTGAGVPPAGGQGEKWKQYIERLRALSPRDAEGFHELGKWCAAEGLAEESRKAFERAIRIDPDHPGARQALGYRPSGLGWTTAGPGGRSAGAPASPADSVGGAPPPVVTATASTPAATASRSPSASGAAPASGPAAASPGGGSPPAGAPGGSPAPGGDGARPAGGEARPEASQVEDPVARRKKWAQEAFAKLALKVSVYEDDDFLIHSTYEAGSAKVKALTTTLKAFKVQVQKLVGRPRGGSLWPGKLHFIYMRASTECMRFAEAIDGQRFPEEVGFYHGGERPLIHTVFSAIPERELAYLMGLLTLQRTRDSDRYVGWWLVEGVSSYLAAATEEGKQERALEQAFLRTAKEMENDFESVSLIKLLDSPEPRSNARERFQAEALTLVHFLLQAGASRLQDLISELRSPEAPALPKEGQDKVFLSRYTAFQETVLTRIYRDKTEKLNDKWKAFVTQKAAEFEKTTRPDTKNQKTQKTQKTQKKAAKGTGKQGGKGGGKDGGEGEGRGD